MRSTRESPNRNFSGNDFEGVLQTAMKRTLVLALAAGLATSTLVAQTAAAPAAGAPAGPPQAIPAKIAVIAFQQGMVSTNEGQATVQSIQKKYEPQKGRIEAQQAEIASLRKQAA